MKFIGGRLFCLLIDGCRIKNALGDCFIRAIGKQATIVTATVSFVAGSSSVLYYPNQQAIFLTIHKYIFHVLHIPRLFALMPDRIAGPAEEVRLSGVQR